MNEEQPVVFVIDDDRSVRDALAGLLRSVGLEVRTFGATQEFLQSERPDAPGCLVLDVRLPGRSGLDFQRELAQTGVHLPVVFITGHGDIPMSVRAIKAGAIEFLPKPFHDQELLDAIQLGIERDRARRQDAAAVAELEERELAAGALGVEPAAQAHRSIGVLAKVADGDDRRLGDGGLHEQTS